MVAAELHVNEFGAIVAAPRTGVPMQNPHLSIATKAADTVSRVAAELGLTPSSRQRVGTTRPAATSPGSGFSAWGLLDEQRDAPN